MSKNTYFRYQKCSYEAQEAHCSKYFDTLSRFHPNDTSTAINCIDKLTNCDHYENATRKRRNIESLINSANNKLSRHDQGCNINLSIDHKISIQQDVTFTVDHLVY